jgi:hypothetical protein
MPNLARLGEYKVDREPWHGTVEVAAGATSDVSVALTAMDWAASFTADRCGPPAF